MSSDSFDLCRDTAAASNTEERPVRIVVLDRQRILRQGLRALLAVQAEFLVVGDTGELSEALSLIEAQCPSVLLTDLYVSEGSRLRHIEEIHARFPQLAILVLTALRGRGLVAAIRRAGALGYLASDHGRGALELALREVAAGRWHRAAERSPRRREAPHRAGALGSPPVYLTERQRQLLRSVALGQRARDIAARAGVSVRAIYAQRQRLRYALQLHSTAALTRFAAREGLTETGASPRR